MRDLGRGEKSTYVDTIINSNALSCVMGKASSDTIRDIFRATDDRACASQPSVNQISLKLREPVAFHVQDCFCTGMQLFHYRQEL